MTPSFIWPSPRVPDERHDQKVPRYAKGASYTYAGGPEGSNHDVRTPNALSADTLNQPPQLHPVRSQELQAGVSRWRV